MVIILAVSGGADSMYLALRRRELFPGATFAVAHCNFHLRGEESDGDCRFVEEWCMSEGLECVVRDFDTAAYAAGHHISIEMAARELRYGWFAELCRERGAHAVAVAHNANDNAETLLLNLLRGTGSRGLRGMSEDSLTAEGLRVLRPLLGTERDEITAFLRSRGCSWREDSSNAGSAYKRNRLRNVVFPALKEINPSFIRTLGRDMEHFAEVDDIAEDCFREAYGRLVRADSEGRVSFDIDGLLDCKHWRYLLWRLVEHSGMSEETFGKMTELLARYKECPRGTVTIGGKSFETPRSLIVIRKGRAYFRDRD